MSVIQRIPEAFLSALGIRGTGQNPRNLPDNVQAVAELGQYYSARFWETINASTPGVTALANATITVPQGEAWRVHSITGSCTATVTTAVLYGVNVSFRPTGIGSAIRVAGRAEIVTSAGDQVHVGSLMAGIILPPGSTINSTSEQIIAAGYTLGVAACIERLSI